MKNYGILLVCSLVWLSNAMAQDAAKITYKETTKLQLPVIEGMDSTMLAAFPSEHSTLKDLYYTKTESLYKKAEVKKADDMQLGDQQSMMVIQMSEPNDCVHADFITNKITQQRDFMSRLFLIESPIESLKWKLTGNQKMILNYTCLEAVIQDSTQNSTIWFAPQLAIPAGPEFFFGFPGLVLAASMNNGEFVLEAVEIDVTPFDQTIIVKPKEGKKVTEQKFKELVEEKQRELQEQYGGDGNTVIRIEKH